MTPPAGARFLASHEYALPLPDGTVQVGITPYAAEQLGDVVYVELPAVGKHFGAGDIFGVVESVKAASDLYVPLAGEVVATNEALSDDPSLVGSGPYEAGWMLKLKPSNPADLDGLLDAAAYSAHTGA